ncbi:hypothetical protein C0J52_28393 [Blattella germanica]|nr:hypothetical protein C0J52_28393 [Blattella germanica]
MKMRGHTTKSAEQIKNKWKSLKSLYATCKKQHAKSGARRRKCDYYDQLNETLGSREGLDSFNEAIPEAIMLEEDPSISYEGFDQLMVGSAAAAASSSPSAGACGSNTTPRSYRKRRRSEFDVYLEHQNSLMREFFHRQEQREEAANRMREREN